MRVIAQKMSMFQPAVGLHPQMGTPDPELETSPIVGEDEDMKVEPNVRGGACTFNGAGFRIGDFVRSGTGPLRCEAPGVWVHEGELRPRTTASRM